MTDLDPTIELARQSARRSQTVHAAAIAQDLEAAAQLPERNTFQGYDSASGLFKRQPLANVANSNNSPATIADGIKVFNRGVRIGKPIWTIPTAGNARLIGQYIRRQIQADRQVLQRRPLVIIPQPVNWMELSATVDGKLLAMTFNSIPTYAAYINPPFATPPQFTGFTTNLDFFELTGLVQIDVNGGSGDSLIGKIDKSDNSFGIYGTKTVGFGYQIFRVNPGSLNIKVTLEQTEITDGDLASNSVTINRSTGARQPNGLYLISFDQSVFSSNLLDIQDAAINVAVSMEIIGN
ncbi:hypothetical protein Pse7367_3957 (plasmid) [Thalassoporum mexicanum PCC 7367]|uniref:hypothetical protein n=1 Tax=Thalassoporum mexicanum TaxID=3457544 RepID=UPI00029F82F7|nr:hypothetical protein [Pseudanabaena sp. PCC 7367]AFY72172.1 hypothetical protein Pse7367_3957 [Pseudanabaena sp. PCC 7367]